MVKVVLLHDWLVGLRGGERVLEALCEMFPQAPIYTLIYEPRSLTPIIEGRPIYTSFLNRLPGINKYYRKLLPFFPLAARTMKIPTDIDLIISSSHCVIKGVPRFNTSIPHISYIHSPMRYIYDQFDIYFGKKAPFYQRIVARMIRGYLRRWDFESNRHVDKMLANSLFVKDRIKKFYGLKANVVNPFVELADFKKVIDNPPKKEDYYIVLSALAPNKRVDLAVLAFNELNLPLKIIGIGQMEKSLKKMAQTNIHFLGRRPREEIVTLLAQARALIFPGIEDFGIVPLESLAAGTPVVAFQQGGVLETLDSNVAQFFASPTKESLIKAVKKISLRKFDRNQLHQKAQFYSKDRFKQQIWEEIDRIVI